MKKFLSIGSITAVSLLALSISSAPQAQAANLVTNGGFVPTGTNVSSVLRGPYTLNGWNFSQQSQPGKTSTNTGFNFAVPDGTAFSTNINQSGFQDSNFTLRFYANPGQVVNSQPDASGGAASGWYFAADGYFERGAINQTLNNLIVGQQYNVSFSQASAQLDVQKEAFNEYFQVGFGNSFQNSALMSSIGAQPASDWQKTIINIYRRFPNSGTEFLGTISKQRAAVRALVWGLP